MNETWLQKHERLLVVLILTVALLIGGNWYLQHDSAVKHDQAVVATEQAKVAEAQAALQAAQYEKDTQTRHEEYLSLLAAIAQRDRASQTKITEVTKPKTPSEAVKDLFTVYNLPEPVVPTDTGALVPTSDIQLFTVTKIDDDTCRADLKDTQTLLSASQAGEAQAQGVIAADAVALDSEKKSHKKDVDDLKSSARKSKRNWFVAGYVAGWASAVAARVFGL